MTKTETANVEATLAQIIRCADAGADLIRCAVPREGDAEALKTLVAQSPIPIIADIHFNHTLALKAIAKALKRSEESTKDRAKADGLSIAKLR